MIYDVARGASYQVGWPGEAIHKDAHALKYAFLFTACRLLLFLKLLIQLLILLLHVRPKAIFRCSVKCHCGALYSSRTIQRVFLEGTSSFRHCALHICLCAVVIIARPSFWQWLLHITLHFEDISSVHLDCRSACRRADTKRASCCACWHQLWPADDYSHARKERSLATRRALVKGAGSRIFL